MKNEYIFHKNLCAVTAGLFLVYRLAIFSLKNAPENDHIYS